MSPKLKDALTWTVILLAAPTILAVFIIGMVWLMKFASQAIR